MHITTIKNMVEASKFLIDFGAKVDILDDVSDW